MQTLVITFKVEYYWTPKRLIIECPSPAARDFVARSLEEKPLIIKVKKQRSEAER
jgi:hypothetical protein